jgi:putative ABC transport system permease protein
MRPRTLLLRSLRHYWRPNLAVILGVATAAAVLGGSLVVGDSVRGSLADTALARLGTATHAVESAGFFRDALASELEAAPAFSPEFAAACPIVALRGVVTHATSERRAGEVAVYGVDGRFWAFQGRAAPEMEGRGAIISQSLADELGASEGDAILVRLDEAEGVPGSTLFGRRDDPARGLRLTVREVRTRDDMGELALRPRGGGMLVVYVPLETLRRALDQADRANVLLVSAEDPDAPDTELDDALEEAVTLEDLGVRLRVLPEAGALQLQTTSALVDDALARAALTAANREGVVVTRLLVYLANSIRVGERTVPYSIVAALDPKTLETLIGSDLPPPGGLPPIVLNDWTARDLHAKPGDRVTLDYYLWREEGQLTRGRAVFQLLAITPMKGIASDPNLVPEYPGITESLHLSDWDPPFPIDLDRIREKDEAYWDRHRTTPKAFVSLTAGQRLWAHRLGRLTSLRFTPGPGVSLEDARARYAATLRQELSAQHRLRVSPVRRAALEAAHGSTDFGQYFVYFSFFLVVAGLLLAGLFFRLGLEQRLREVGLLEALGFSAARLRRQYLGEGLVLAALGGVLGIVAAAAYAALVLWALRALWTADLGTRDLTLHLDVVSPLLGGLGAALAAVGAVAWTLRDLRRLSPRTLLAGSLEPWSKVRTRGHAVLPWVLLVLAGGLVVASTVRVLSETAGFFSAGGLLLVSALLFARHGLGGRPRSATPLRSVAALGVRGLSFRPGRTVLCIALVAAATFVIVSVGAFRKEGAVDVSDPHGESGGFRLMARSLVPLHHAPFTPEGRAALGLEEADLQGVGVARFRARRGEDASCLNLYQPRTPTVLAPTAAFLRAQRFRFKEAYVVTPEERANPWLILERDRYPDGAIPVIADAGSLMYILHRKLGDTMEIGDTGVRVRFAATLAPGLFQSEILMGERHFLEAFPDQGGYSFFLLDVTPDRADTVSQTLESRLADFGFDVSRTADRLRAYHSVENTYIATFQALGALGLLLGTIGLATVLVRNALEQQGQLALLRAVGYQRSDLSRMVLSENAALVGLGFLAGAVPALLAITPVLLGGRGALPLALVGGLLLALGVTGVAVSWLAVTFIQRFPLVESLRAE